MDPRIEQNRQTLNKLPTDELVAQLRKLGGPRQMGCQRAGGLLAAADRLEAVWREVQALAVRAGIDPESV